MIVFDPISAGKGNRSVRQKFYLDANTSPSFWVLPQYNNLIELLVKLVDGKFVDEVRFQNASIGIGYSIGYILFHLLLCSLLLFLFLGNWELNVRKWVYSIISIGSIVHETYTYFRRGV